MRKVRKLRPPVPLARADSGSRQEAEPSEEETEARVAALVGALLGPNMGEWGDGRWASGSGGNGDVQKGLNSPVDVTPTPGCRPIRLLLEPCSLLVMEGESRLLWNHAIPKVGGETDSSDRWWPRTRRVSVTLRRVFEGMSGLPHPQSRPRA